MNYDAFIEHLVKTVLQEVIKKFIGLSFLEKELFNSFSKKRIEPYLKQKAKLFGTIKTILHSNPVDFNLIYQSVEFEYKHAHITYKEVKDLFKISSYISIIGRAGSGKTTFTKHIFLKAIEEGYKIPVMITFRDLKDGMNLKEAIMHAISASSDDLSCIEKYLQKGKFFIILDGFDEKVDTQFSRHSENIFNCLLKYTENSYMVTSRPHSGAERLQQFHNLYVMQLNYEGQIEFIKKQLIANGNSDEEIDAITNSVGKQGKSVSQFLGNPLLLLFYIITFNHTDTVPSHRYEFYKRTFDVLFMYHDAQKLNFNRKYSRELSSQLEKCVFEKIVGNFSFISYIELELQFDKSYFQKKIKQIQRKFECCDFDIDKFLYDIEVNVPILSEEDDEYFFVHASIQEYWCVRFIKELSIDDSKKKAYLKIRESLSKRLGYQIDNFASLCCDVDEINYKQYFYIPSLKIVTQDVLILIKELNKTMNEKEEYYYNAYYFLSNMIKIILVDRNPESNYLLMNSKYSSSIFILKKFPTYESLISKIYKYLGNKFFIKRYLTESKATNDKDCAIRLIIENNHDIVQSINILLQEISLEINKVQKQIDSSMKRETDFIDDLL